MSTRKVKDGPAIRTKSTTNKTEKSRGTAKKEVPKTRTSSRTQGKKAEDEDDKRAQKQILKVPPNQDSRRIAAITKRVGNATKTSGRPVTPPSSRVTKSQFFPTKKIYANALRDVNNKKTANLSLQKGDVSPDSSSMSDRPRTATLRKGSIVNANIVGPEVSRKLRTHVIVDGLPDPSRAVRASVGNISNRVSEDVKKIPATAVPIEEDASVEYEDDFDSYESDFEEYESSDSTPNMSSGTIATSDDSSESDTTGFTSTAKGVGSSGTDDEKKLDSGNYELPESKHRQILDNIKESTEKETANLSNLGSLSDEGFEDGKSLQFINFLGAQKKYKQRKSIEMRRKRGEEILSMIRLDQYNFILFDLAPVPYDIFIRNFGKSNTVQESVQTGDDDVSEETQTEQILSENKWTQYPACFEKINNEENFWEIYKYNYLGVGGDFINKQKTKIIHTDNDLEKFLLNTGNVILNLLNEDYKGITIKANDSNIPFSKSYISFNTQSHELLHLRPVKDVNFCPSNSDKVLTAHGKIEEDFEKSFVCLWNLTNLVSPEMFLVIFGDVMCCTFSLNNTSLIIGGLSNGCLAVWDTNENTKCHKNVYRDPHSDVILRSPTYSTEISYGHDCKVISVQCMSKTSKDPNLFFTPKTSEVCSLDEDGIVIIWSIIVKEESYGKITERQGLAHWGSVIITINNKISLSNLYPDIDDFSCTALGLSHLDSTNLYISTSYGVIIHCLASGSRTSVKKFHPDAQTQANCLEMCPFSSQYFIVGFDNGHISFYSRNIEKPLMVLSNKDITEGQSKIQLLQWSQNRPFVFYTKDGTNTVHIWNLKISDMFPIYSIPFKEKVLCMKLSKTVNNDDILENTYLMIVTENGAVYVHLLGDEHDQLSSEDFEKDKRKFLNYINRYV